MELDVYIPSLNLAFEYQGKQHFTNIYSMQDHTKVQERDSEKRALCSSLGIDLIEIPYWWDGSVNSLLATIHQIRPQLISKDT